MILTVSDWKQLQPPPPPSMDGQEEFLIRVLRRLKTEGELSKTGLRSLWNSHVIHFANDVFYDAIEKGLVKRRLVRRTPTSTTPALLASITDAGREFLELCEDQ